MGLFDLFKKKAAMAENSMVTETKPLENPPEMLGFKLLFIEKPVLDAETILAEANYFMSIDHSIVSQLDEEKTLIFTFPDYEVNLIDATGPAQCIVNINQSLNLPDVAFQQNWDWPEANEIAENCKYEVLVADMLSRTLPYKQRITMVMNFLAAVIRSTNPDAVYSLPAQKLIDPQKLKNKLWDDENDILYGVCNVRLYNITDAEENDILMDTIGLNSIGLPDFQINCFGFDVNQLVSLLWNYAYYIYHAGDVINSGNTLEGVTPNSAWKCEKQISLIEPQRAVINIQVK